MCPQQLRIPVDEARAAALAALADFLAGDLPLESLLCRVLERAIHALGAGAGAIVCPGIHAGGAALAVLRGCSADQQQALQRLHDEARLAEAVLASGEPIALAGLPLDPRFPGGLRASLRAADLNCYAGVPLLTRAGVRGVLAVAGAAQGFAAADLEFLAGLGNPLALLVENAALELAGDRWRAAAAALAQLGRVAGGTGGVSRILEMVPEQALALVGGEACGVFVLDRAAGHLVLARGVGLEGRPGARDPIPLGCGVVGRAVVSRAPAAAGNGAGPAGRPEVGFPAVLAVPLVVRGEPFGALALYRARPLPFAEVDAGLLALVAAHAAIAIENARLLHQEQARRQQVEAVRAVSGEIQRELDLPRLLGLIQWRAAELVGAASGAVYLWDEEAEFLVPKAWFGHGEWMREARLRMGEGVAGSVARQLRGLIVNDYRHWPHASPLMLERTGVTAALAEPLLYRDRFVGVIAVNHEQPGRAFTEPDRETLALFAGQAAIAIENARLYGEAERRRREAEVLAEVARDVNASLNLQAVLQRVADGALELCGSDMAGIALWDHGSEAMLFRHRVGSRSQAYDGLRITLGRGIGGRVLVSGRPFRTHHYAEDSQVSRDDLGAVLAEGIVAEMVVPIRIGDRVEGLLYVDNRTARPFTDGDEAILLRLADCAATAIANAQLYSQTREGLEELEAIHRAGQAIAQSLDLDETLRHILVAAMRLTETDKATIHLLDEERQELVTTSVAGQTVDRALRVPLAEPSLAAACLRHGRVLVSESPETDPRCNPTLQARYRDKALVVVPLRSGQRTVGALGVRDAKRRRHFGAREVAVLERLAQQAAVAIENARLFDQVLRSKSEWENTFDSISDLAAVLDLEGRIVRANRALLRRLGLPPGQVLRRPCGDVFGDDGAAWGGCPHRRALCGGAPVALEVEDERLSGSYAVSVFPVRDPGGRLMGTVHIARDITEQKAIQAKLFQADKLASMGTLAAGVAHSINNVLAAIVARADLLLVSASDAEARRSAEVIQQAAMDGAETVRRLQEFAKIKPRPAVGLVDVNQAARDALEFTQARWRDEAQARGAPIAVESRLEAAASIEGNAAEMREVFINLILNAVDAMPRGGRLRIVTADRPGRPAAGPELAGSAAGTGMVEVRVEDSGIGMSEAVRLRIFDPFFTTKGLTGTGLGLSVSYGLVTKYRGEIAVRSREGEGTTFMLTFPVAGSSSDAAPAPAPAPDASPGRVLVIEDEATLREAMAAALSMAGHQVEAVAGGREGIERFRAGAFDVVLTDLGMPDVSGLDVARAVKAADPTVYVILCTGWGNVPGAEGPLRDRGVDALLAKPFRIAEVMKLVQAGVEAHAAASAA